MKYKNKAFITPYTNTQLEQVLAKMLPQEVAYCNAGIPYFNKASKVLDKPSLMWKDENFPVKDTELLHLCWMVEEGLTNDECNYYSQQLRDAQLIHNPTALGWFFHATWQQRVIALANVKGIEIL